MPDGVHEAAMSLALAMTVNDCVTVEKLYSNWLSVMLCPSNLKLDSYWILIRSTWDARAALAAPPHERVRSHITETGWDNRAVRGCAGSERARQRCVRVVNEAKRGVSSLLVVYRYQARAMGNGLYYRPVPSRERGTPAR